MLRYYIIPFLLPPGVCVALLVVGGLWFLLRRRALCGAVCVLFAALLWALASGPLSHRLVAGLESPYYRLPAPPRGDVIVLLGGGIAGEAPDFSGVGTPTEESMARIVTAVRLQKALGVPIIVSGGKVFEGSRPEAPVAGRIVADLGVPPGKIILEERSRDTMENARNSMRICAERGFRTPVVVTSAFHMSRALFAFELAGAKAVPCPAAFRSWPGKRLQPVDYLPGAASMRQTAMAASERIGMLVYRIAR